jgi:phage shock protein C
MIENIISYFEKQAFGVCSWWGEKLGVSSSKIRLFFIYLSFFTAGSPIIIYLGMAFILEHKELLKFKKKRLSIWDL